MAAAAPAYCPICEHPARREVDRFLLAGPEATRAAVMQYQLAMGPVVVHLRRCLAGVAPVTPALVRKSARHADLDFALELMILDRINGLGSLSELTLQMAEDAYLVGDTATALEAIKTAAAIAGGGELQWSKLLADLQGRIRRVPRKLVQVNVAGSTEAAAVVQAAVAELPEELPSGLDGASVEELLHFAEVAPKDCEAARRGACRVHAPSVLLERGPA